MITTSDVVIVTLDSIEQYDSPNLVCFPTYNPETGKCLVNVSIRDSSEVHLRYAEFELDYVDLDSQTLSASTNTDKWMEAVELTLVAKLESLNPSASFSIV